MQAFSAALGRSGRPSHAALDLSELQALGDRPAARWALLLDLGAFDATECADRVARRPELSADAFPPLTDAQIGEAGVLRAWLIHQKTRRSADDGSPTRRPDDDDAAAEPSA